MKNGLKQNINIFELISHSENNQNIKITTSESSLLDIFLLNKNIEEIKLDILVNNNSIKNDLDPFYTKGIEFNVLKEESFPKYNIIHKYENIITALEEENINIKEYKGKLDMKARSIRLDDKLVIGSSNFNDDNINLDFLTTNLEDLQQYDEWFEEKYNHKHVEEVNQKIIEKIEDLSTPLNKEEIFSKIISKLFSSEWEETKVIKRFFESEWYRNLWSHQKIAVAKTLKSFENDNNSTFMIADEVGLGKTASAVSIAAYYSLFARGGVKVIAPKNIVNNNWDNFKRTKVQPFNKTMDLNATSISDLSRNGLVADITEASFQNVKLLIIDESQYLKNTNSQRSSKFWEITRNAVDNGMKVLLLTATPISNNLMELFNQLNLGKENNQILKIKKIFKQQDKELKETNNEFKFNEKLVNFIQERVIARTKLDLKERNPDTKIPSLKKENVFQVHYKKYSNQEEIINTIDKISHKSKMNHLVKFGFYKRLEESLTSLKSSINKSNLSLKDIVSNNEWDNEEELEINDEILKIDNKDLTRLNALIDTSLENDYKFNKLNKIINKENDKFIIFSSSIQTIKYLYDKLVLSNPHKKIAYITGSLHKSNYSNKYNIKDLIFLSSKEHNVPTKKELINEKEIDILIVSNAYAEGQNLQSFKRLINYDITWNPMILQQRLGRIYRLNSSHKNIYLYNFWPEEQIKHFLGLHNKMYVKTSKSLLVSDLPDIFGFKEQIKITTDKEDKHELEAQIFEKNSLSILNELNPIDVIKNGSYIQTGWYSILKGEQEEIYNLFRQKSTLKYFFLYTDKQNIIYKESIKNLMDFKRKYSSYKDIEKNYIYNNKEYLSKFDNRLNQQIKELNNIIDSIKQEDKEFELVSTIFIIKQ